MRKLLFSYLCGIVLVGCNYGSSGNSDSSTPYLFNSLDIDTISSENCSTNNAGFTYSCSNESSVLALTITYSSVPASYIVFPQIMPSGVSLNLGNNCSFSPVSNYSCTFSISALNAESNTSVNLLLDGSLGIESFITINY